MEWIPVLLLLWGAASLAGFVAGFFGIGGGIILVPILEFSLSVIGLEPTLRMHIAVATSMAIVVPTSLVSARVYYQRGDLDMQRALTWAPMILSGGIAGSLLASYLDGPYLMVFFGLLMMGLAIKLSLPSPVVESRYCEAGKTNPGLPALLGFVSGMSGSGGTFITPVLRLRGLSIQNAAATSSLLAVVLAVPATLAYVLTGWMAKGLPVGNVGYVSLLAVLVMAPVSMLVVPWGARSSRVLTQKIVTRLLSVLLLAVGGRMLMVSFLF